MQSTEPTCATVLVTSLNTVKIEGVRVAMHKFMGIPPVVEAEEHGSGISHGQPWSHLQAYEGAKERIRNAQTDGYTHVVSIESGVHVIPGHASVIAFDFVCAVVLIVETGQVAVAFSQDRLFPLEQAQAMKRQGAMGSEIGEYIQMFYECAHLPCSRTQQVTQATTMALSQIDLL